MGRFLSLWMEIQNSEGRMKYGVLKKEFISVRKIESYALLSICTPSSVRALYGRPLTLYIL